MDVALDWNELSDSLREPFIGIPVHFEFDCNCAVCQKSPIQTDRHRLHIAIFPVDKDIDIQHAWYTYSAKKLSSWGAFVLALNRLNIKARSLDFLKEMMLKTIFEWQDWSIVKYLSVYGKIEIPSKIPEKLAKKTTWLPTKIVSPKELEFIARNILRDEQGKVKSLDEIIEIAQEEWKKTLQKHENEIGSEIDYAEYDMTSLE